MEKKTYNPYYGYPEKGLWEDEVWQGRISHLRPLAHTVYDLNNRNARVTAKPAGEYKAEGDYDVQQLCWIYPEVVEELKAKGLHYHTTRHCIYLTPYAHREKKGYDDDMDTLFVLVDGDLHYDNWNMATLEQYRAYIDYAAEHYMALMFIVGDGKPYVDYISLIQEAIVLFHYNYHRLYLDVTPVIRAGKRVSDVDFIYDDLRGGAADPDAFTKDYDGVMTGLDISGRWASKVSLTQDLIVHSGGNAAYVPDEVINSAEGRLMAEGIRLELEYDDFHDPRLVDEFDKKGLRYDVNYYEGEQWVVFTPKCAFDEPEKKLPVMCILQEVGDYDLHQSVTAFAYTYEYFDLAAQGDLMLLYFVLEGFDDNDLLHDILDEAARKYPMLDRSRVYITGHSHDGRFTAEYMRRHPGDIAAMATLGNEPGQIAPEWTSGFFQVSDEKIELQSKIDMPTINISGYLERNCMFPLYKDAPNPRPGAWIALNTREKRLISWQRRLRSARCPVKTIEEIAATEHSEDYVERMLGIPADKTECLYLNGHENYIADIKNVDGKWHFRIVALGDMPHTITPTMVDLTWSFVRRFARDPETGETIELY